MSRGPDVFIVAGEASADLLGAQLVKELKDVLPDARFYGVGGKRLAQEGMEILLPAERLNIVGGSDWKDKLFQVLRDYRAVKEQTRVRRPDIAVLLDLPDFNLKMARHLKKLGVPVVYYVSPQVWAWRSYRVKQIRKNVARMLVVFPFEKRFYDEHGVDCRFVGHPLVEQIERRRSYRSQEEVHAAPRIALLPGSRPSELRHHAELLKETTRRLKHQYPTCEIRVPIASTLTRKEVETALEGAPVTYADDSREVLTWADVALVASGTATLETAILGTPFCLFYRMSRSSTWIIRYLIRYRRFFGMPNLLHGREVVREFLHHAASPEALVREARWLIEDERYRRGLADRLAECRRLLGETGASRRAALQVQQVYLSRPSTEAQLVPAPI